MHSLFSKVSENVKVTTKDCKNGDYYIFLSRYPYLFGHRAFRDRARANCLQAFSIYLCCIILLVIAIILSRKALTVTI